MSTASERRSPNQVKLVTLYIFGASMPRIKVTCDSETAMLCLVPRDPTHLAACRRWPALCGVSALCVRGAIDTTLLRLCAGDYRLRNHCAGTVSKSPTSLLDNPAHGDSDDVTSQTAVHGAEYDGTEFVIRRVWNEAVMAALFWHSAC